MSRRNRHCLSLIVGAIALGFLGWLTRDTPLPSINWLQWIAFVALVVFTTTFGVPLGGGEVSFLPMTVVAAYLAMGPIPTAWAAYLGAMVHGVLRQMWASQLQARREPDLLSLLAVSTANATMHSMSILVGGQVYRMLGGVAPLLLADLQPWPLVLLCAAYLSVNLLLAGLYITVLGRASTRVYVRSLPNLVAYEASPLVLAPLMALTYTHLGLGQFLLFSLALVGVSLIARNLALSRRRLERTVKELDSLRAVGQALSATLELDVILEAVYDQVSQLMPARSSYIALYDADTDEVSFPLAIENGQRRRWPSRCLGNGLTEYVLRTGTPVLVERDVRKRLKALGLEEIGSPADSWLGVPILAGTDPLGVIAVQSPDTPGVYDHSHEQILVTIAGQAAAAIRNARLYERTDEALASRVQELNSILRTTREGILLVDRRWQIAAANRELAQFLGAAQLDLVGQLLTDSLALGETPLIERLGYTISELQADCAALAQEGGECKQTVVLGPPERFLERTLAPVRDRSGEITGWLLVFRDVTEEVELSRFRDDVARMLVHDLRSPLAVLRGSLDMIEIDVAHGRADRVGHWLEAGRGGSDRMLHLIDQLLDISKLESGQMPTAPQVVHVRALFEETAQRLSTLAREVRIDLQISTEPELPFLYVDPGLIGRALVNLVDNAIKFTAGGGTVRLWARSDPGGGPSSLLVGVSDTGPGIPAEEQSRLFQKFQQVAPAQGRRRGTGLGLSFCRLAVEAHGGQIRIESPSREIEAAREGEGSTFIMRLPAAGAVDDGGSAAKEEDR